MHSAARTTARALRSCTRAFSSTPLARLSNSNPLDPQPHPPSSTSAASGQPAPGAPPTPGSTAGTSRDGHTTHFGFRDVPEQLKESLVKGVFSSVASSYDVMNDAMSLGIHRLWKDHYVSKLNPHGGLNCLDVAGGTGDIAMRILDHAREKYGDRETKVTMLDINPEMLEEGKKRFAKTMYHATPQVDFLLGNAENLHQIPDNTMDLYTIAFGIRNVTRIDVALKEAFRVLKPGGVLSVLEFSKVPNPVLAKAYELWSFNVIPNLGHILAADRDSYQYLIESIAKFPNAETFAQMLERAGFTVAQDERAELLTHGIAAIHTGVAVK
ncbi:hypothetical protein JCM8547_001848 [Rhodosporidiobolus lusitaniae]